VIESPEPQQKDLTASDGVALAGTFYPAAGCGAPVVLLFHQFGSDRSSWTDLALWMQNRFDETASTGGRLASPAVQYSWFPPLPADISVAVFTIDFRDHGDSEPVSGGLDTTGFLLDAQAALEYAKTLSNVDPNRIITIGASIGADASVDVCLNLDGTTILEPQSGEGCIGALSLSPGSFLEVPYVEAVTRLGGAPIPPVIRCLAAEQDGNSPDLCAAEVPGNFQGTIFAGRNEHGIALLAEGFDPDIGQLIHDFLLETLGITG
jgi:pimeloyl-ACP methyl ester carboxylesterase